MYCVVIRNYLAEYNIYEKYKIIRLYRQTLCDL